MSNKIKLYTKILDVVSKMEAIEKSGYNTHQKYSYSTEEDLVNGIRSLIVANKLLVLTSSEIKEVQKLNKSDKNAANGFKETLVAIVTTRHKFIDVETGESEEVTSSGMGWDDTDKGSFKAITGAMKYFISKNFLVPGKDDAENDGLPKEPVTVSAPRTFNKPGAPAPKLTVTSPTHKVETKQVGDTTQVTLSGPIPVPVEEPKEELIKSAPVTPTVSKVFQRRTTLNSNKEPKF